MTGRYKIITFYWKIGGVRCWYGVGNHRSLNQTNPGTYMPIPNGDEAWYLVVADFLGRFPVSPRSNKYLLVIVDHLTGFHIVFPTETQTAKETALRFLDAFGQYVHSKVLITDQGRNFLSNTIAEYNRLFNVDQCITRRRGWDHFRGERQWRSYGGEKERIEYKQANRGSPTQSKELETTKNQQQRHQKISDKKIDKRFFHEFSSQRKHDIRQLILIREIEISGGGEVISV